MSYKWQNILTFLVCRIYSSKLITAFVSISFFAIIRLKRVILLNSSCRCFPFRLPTLWSRPGSRTYELLCKLVLDLAALCELRL